MNIPTEYINNYYLKFHQRGFIFQAADFLGQFPGMGVAIGAGRIALSILAMFGAGFVYGGAYWFRNEALKETCLFVHERAVDETIRGIYEVIAYGLLCAKSARKIASKVSSWISPTEKNHNYFAHGSHLTVDSKRRIRYYTKEEALRLNLSSNIETNNNPDKELSAEGSKEEAPLYNSDSTMNVQNFMSDLLRDLENIYSKSGYALINNPSVDTSCYL